MQIIIKTVDLIKILNAGKSFKQKDFLLYGDRLYGLDNICNYLTFTSNLSLSCMCYYNMAIKFNYKELSAFVNSLISEEEIVFNNGVGYNACGIELHIEYHFMWTNLIKDKLANRNQINSIDYGDITTDLEIVFNMKKADGVYYYKKDRYFMTLFPGLLPVNKNDKVFMSIHDVNNNVFISEFIVKKKNIDIYVDIAYLRVY